jgi:ABC-type uncharacterized transport system fused permease/ATPase subunit
VSQILATIVATTVSAAPYGALPLVSCFSYTAIGVAMAYSLLKPIVPLVYIRNKLEGGFRMTHARVREFSECIAMYHGEFVEKTVSGKAFASLYEVRPWLDAVVGAAGALDATGCVLRSRRTWS